jgi:hypothetical protein
MTEEANNTQTKILQEAIQALGNRGIEHGYFIDNFAHTASLWSAYLGIGIKVESVPIMMALHKISRVSKGNSKQADHYVDACGYIALAGAVAIHD